VCDVISRRRGENDLSKSCFLFDLTLLNIDEADRSKMLFRNLILPRSYVMCLPQPV
jgi:hypothetical protein